MEYMCLFQFWFPQGIGLGVGLLGHMVAGIKTIPREKKCKKAKWLSEEAFQREKKRSERQRRKGKIIPFECRVPKNSKDRKVRKSSSAINAKK